MALPAAPPTLQLARVYVLQTKIRHSFEAIKSTSTTVIRMRVCDFEQAVWETDRLRIVVRAGIEEIVPNFDWKYAADLNSRLANYLDNRIASRLGNLDYIVIDGNGRVPNGNTRLATLRQSYLR